MLKYNNVNDTQPTIVFLEGDSSTLIKQDLKLIRKFAEVARLLPTKDVKFIQGWSRKQIEKEIHKWAAKHNKTKVLVVAAHSNRDGIKLDQSNLLSWGEFGDLIKPLKPTYLVMIACEAGSWGTSKILFKQVDSLDKIYASPSNINEEGAAVYSVLIPPLLYGSGLSPALEKAIGVGNFFNNGNILYRTTRQEVEQADSKTEQMNKVADDVARFVSRFRR